jgi:hypothetical protein
VLILNLPSPPGQRLWRDTAGGFGTSLSNPHGNKISGEAPLYPFLPYAASVLKEAGMEFKIIDCQRLKIGNDETIECVKKANPNIIFSIISLPSMSNDLKILDRIKESIQNVTTIGLGTVCRVIPDEILSKSKLSIIFRNSYPHVNGVTKLIEVLQKSETLKKIKGISYVENGHIIHTPEAPESKLEDLPNPNYESISLDGYATYSDKWGRSSPYVVILESKGCPYGCIYCPYPLGYGKKLTFRSVDKIVDEIEYLHYVRHINVFAFKGQTFAYNKIHATKICDEIIKRKLDIAWYCESRVDEITQNLVKRMKEAGCIRIHFGVETGDPETLKLAKPGVKIDTIRKAFSLTERYNLVTQAHVVLGWPEDTQTTLKNTHKFLLELNPDVLNLNFLTPYPGTKMYEIAQKNSLLLTHDWSNFTSHKVVMKTKSLNECQMYKIRDKIVRDFSIKKLESLLLDFIPQNIEPMRYLNKAKSLASSAIFPAQY